MMREYPFRVLIALITFGVGTAVAFTADRLLSAAIDPFPVVEVETEAAVHPRFSPGDWGCWRGSHQFYKTDDGQEVGEGDVYGESPEDARRQFQEQTREATPVVEQQVSFESTRNEFRERVVLIYKTDQSEGAVTILRYDGGDSYRYIDAPTLALALEFEQHLITEVYY